MSDKSAQSAVPEFHTHPPRLGKKVGRREDLLNIEVTCLGRIRQRDRGVGFSLLVQKILQDGFGIDPDEFFPQDAIQQVNVAGVDAVRSEERRVRKRSEVRW